MNTKVDLNFSIRLTVLLGIKYNANILMLIVYTVIRLIYIKLETNF